MIARLAALAALFTFAGSAVAAPQSNLNATWLDKDGSYFTVVTTPAGGEMRGTITMAVPPAPDCKAAVGVATPFIGYTNSAQKMVQVIIVNWTETGCHGVTAWIGPFAPTPTTVDWNTTRYYADHTSSNTGTDTWVLQHVWPPKGVSPKSMPRKKD